LALEKTVAPQLPSGAKQVPSRSIHRWTLKTYASPSGISLERVLVNWELINPQSSVRASGGSTLGLALSSGVVLTGSSESGQWTVNKVVVTTPNITDTRLIAGGKVLDSMVPVDYDNVRFVVLATRGAVPSSAVVQGIDRSGAVVATDRYSFPPRPSQ
jgi:hypothetical protein